MSQNSNQNIDDILQQLKSKMNSENNSGETLNMADIYASIPSETDDMSAADLQNELKNQFISNTSTEKSENGVPGDEEDGYKLDTDFLNEAQNYVADAVSASEFGEQDTEELTEEESEISIYEDDEALTDDNAEPMEDNMPLLDEDNERGENKAVGHSYEYYRNLSDKDLKFIIDDSEESEEAIWQEEDEAAEEDEVAEADEIAEEDEEYFEDDDVEDGMLLEDEDIAEIEEENINEELAERINATEENKRSFVSVLKETAAQDAVAAEEEITEAEDVAILQSEEDVALEDEALSEDVPDDASEDDFLNTYFSELLIEKAEEEDISEEELFDVDQEPVADVAESVLAEEERELSSEEAENELLLQLGYDIYDSVKKPKPFDTKRKERIRQGYIRKRKNLWLTFAGSLAIMVVLFFYELLPTRGYEFAIIINAEEYPVAYMLIGLQLLVACAALSWKKLWVGIKNIASSTPDHNSIIFITSVFTVVYDLVVAISNYNTIPPMFNFLAVFTINLSIAIDIIMLQCEMKAFSIYFSNDVKYTSVTDKRLSSVAEKMYRGGLAPSQNVYVPTEFSPTSSFFRSLDNSGETKKSMYSVSIPVVAAALLIWVCGIVLEKGAVMSVSTAMTALFAVLPIAVVIADVLPAIIMNVRLHKRDIVVSGVGTAKSFSKCNIMVFKDIHFFEKCIPQNTGMVFYDETNAHLVFKCLNAIYSEINSPMADVFVGISKSDDEKHDVRFVRLVSNGIEAVVDRKYSVLVGTAEFMDRYGIEFRKTDSEIAGVDAEPLCVALNGKATAKLSVKYKAVGIFEMIVEKLAKENVFCAIETYDPLINSALINKSRMFGKTPVSVVHLNFNDYAREKYDRKTDSIALVNGENVGICANRSRLKLAEALIWCKRMIELRRGNAAIIWIGSVVGIILSCLGYFVSRSVVEIDQFTVLAFEGVLCLFIFVVTMLSMPKKDYFKFDKFREKMLAQQEKQSKKDEKKAARAIISEAKRNGKNKKKSEKKQKKI